MSFKVRAFKIKLVFSSENCDNVAAYCTYVLFLIEISSLYSIYLKKYIYKMTSIFGFLLVFTRLSRRRRKTLTRRYRSTPRWSGQHRRTRGCRRDGRTNSATDCETRGRTAREPRCCPRLRKTINARRAQLKVSSIIFRWNNN